MENVSHSLEITSNGTKESERQHLKQKDPDNEAKHRVKKKGENVTNRDSSNVLNISSWGGAALFVGKRVEGRVT